MVNLIIVSIILFFVAALFEIGGAYLVFRWIKEKKTLLMGLVGGIVLFLYGVIQTFQVAGFGRVYAAYGGIFVITTLVWGAVVDRKTPDKYDVIGMLTILLGVAIIFFVPR